MTKIHSIGSFLTHFLRRNKQAVMPSRGYYNLGIAEHGLATSVNLVVNRNQPTVRIEVRIQVGLVQVPAVQIQQRPRRLLLTGTEHGSRTETCLP